MPEALGFRAIAARFSQDGEIAQGQMAKDPLVHAAKLVRPLERQDPPPAGFSLGQLAGSARRREFIPFYEELSVLPGCS